MKRALLLLGALIILPVVAHGQATAVKICDAATPTHCMGLTLPDGGPPAATAYALPTAPAGIWLNPSVNYAFSNCAAVGSSMQVIPNGKYLMRVMQEEVNLVFGTSYDGGTSNNRPFPSSYSMVEIFSAADGGTLVACQSTGGTGDVYFTGTHN
jgi:hypothetical protein